MRKEWWEVSNGKFKSKYTELDLAYTQRLFECVKAGNKIGWSGVISEDMPRIISLFLKIIKIVMNNKLENFGKVIK